MTDITCFCPICGNPVFVSRRKYCSPECAKIAHRRQAAESDRRRRAVRARPTAKRGRKKSIDPAVMAEYKRVWSARYRQSHPENVRQNEARYRERRADRLGADAVALHLRALDHERRAKGKEIREARGEHPIAIARKALGMTQKELAQAAGVSVNSIRNYEEYVITPRRDTLEKIAQALAVDVDRLLQI